jgi:hypothetical protein
MFGYQLISQCLGHSARLGLAAGVGADLPPDCKVGPLVAAWDDTLLSPVVTSTSCTVSNAPQHTVTDMAETPHMPHSLCCMHRTISQLFLHPVAMRLAEVSIPAT